MDSGKYDNSETTACLRKWNTGDRDSLNILLKKHLPWIQSYVRRKLGSKLRSRTESGDIVQEAVVEFLKYGPRIQLSNTAQFRALLGKIVENVLCDEYDRITALRRKISREQPLPTDTVLNLDPSEQMATPPSSALLRNENEAWIRLGIELIKVEDRRIIILRTWEKLPFSEIAKRLGIAENAARMRYNRALVRLAGKVGLLRRGELDTLIDDQDDPGKG